MEASHRTLLIVEDSPTVGRMIVRYVTSVAPTYTVRLCATGTEALDVLDQTHVVAVVTDYTLPDGNGVTLAQTIIERWPTIPIILWTGHHTPAIRDAAFGVGCVSVLMKPMPLPQFWASIQPFLSTSAPYKERNVGSK